MLYQFSSEIAYSGRKESEYVSFEQMLPILDSYIAEMKHYKERKTTIYILDNPQSKDDYGEYYLNEIELDCLKEELEEIHKNHKDNFTLVEINTVYWSKDVKSI